MWPWLTLCAPISHRWDLATEQRPIQELITFLDHRADAPPAAIEQLCHVLVQTDRLKFVGARPDPSTAEAVLQAARFALDLLEEIWSSALSSSSGAVSKSGWPFLVRVSRE